MQMQKSLFAPHSTDEKFAGKGAEGNFQLATIPRKKKEERRRLSDGRRVSSKNKRKSSTRVSISSANLDERSVLLSPYLWYQRSAPHGSDALPSFDFLNPTRGFLYVDRGRRLFHPPFSLPCEFNIPACRSNFLRVSVLSTISSPGNFTFDAIFSFFSGSLLSFSLLLVSCFDGFWRILCHLKGVKGFLF